MGRHLQSDKLKTNNYYFGFNNSKKNISSFLSITKLELNEYYFKLRNTFFQLLILDVSFYVISTFEIEKIKFIFILASAAMLIWGQKNYSFAICLFVTGKLFRKIVLYLKNALTVPKYF